MLELDMSRSDLTLPNKAADSDHRPRVRRILSKILLSGVASIAFAGFTAAAAELPTEAPAGFDTPTLVEKPGSRSTSNGITEPPGDTFVLDQQKYEEAEDVTTGLGPVYNARACSDCHQNPVSGAASQITELRAGHLDQNGNFVNATVPINHGANTIANRSIINDRAVVPEAQEHVPATENICVLRATLNTLGDGFVEAIDDNTLLAIARRQDVSTHGRIHGEAILVPVLEAPGRTRVGRFGWKNQHSSLLSFVGDAYLNEMGITNRLRPTDTTTIGKITSDPEDVPDGLGLAAIDHFAQFIRGTKVPPRDTALAATPTAVAGHRLFERLGCAICHVESIVTAPAGTVINGGTFTVPEALGNKIIHPFSDYLLHDIGTGDGIMQGGPQDTRNKLRTAPLWGLRERPRFMHDLKSLSIKDAIERHRGEAELPGGGGEAELPVINFFGLSETEKQALLTFLSSL
jgi:CxxC motif-containing protein (DUF1111 family)